MTTPPFALIVCIGLLLGTGCRARYDASEPIQAIPQACCSTGDPELKHFEGCRPTGRCKAGEPYWMRGAIMCGPVDETACSGGRCCEYRVPEASTPEPDATESEPSNTTESNPPTTESAPASDEPETSEATLESAPETAPDRA